jgi:hypothetical protein
MATNRRSGSDSAAGRVGTEAYGVKTGRSAPAGGSNST